MKRLIFVLVLAVATMTLMSAQTTALTVAGFVNTSCGSWTQARANRHSAKMEYWVLGFVSGLNIMFYGKDNIDILKGKHSKALFSWLDNYCRSHPLELFREAVAYLTVELKVQAYH